MPRVQTPTSTPTITRTDAESMEIGVRELVAVREIVQAFLAAERAEDVFSFALERVSPLARAALACVYVIDPGSELMRLAASYNWPARYALFLGEVRVRLGFGPSGEAVSERRMIEVPDVFADPSMEDWQDVANELHFRSLVALPLQSGPEVFGAVTFYFAEPSALSSETRGLLRMVAEQMAATAGKVRLVSELRRENAELRERVARLEAQG